MNVMNVTGTIKDSFDGPYTPRKAYTPSPTYKVDDGVFLHNADLVPVSIQQGIELAKAMPRRCETVQVAVSTDLVPRSGWNLVSKPFALQEVPREAYSGGQSSPVIPRESLFRLPRARRRTLAEHGINRVLGNDKSGRASGQISLGKDYK